MLYDTQVTDVASMENHAGRQEVQEALENGSGESSRYSDTLLQQTLYVARRLTDGTVLRISVSRATAGMLALGMIQPMLVVLVAALIFAGLMAGRLSRRIVDPLNRLDLEHPLENDAYEELAPLLSRINYQHKEIDAQLRSLRQKTDEFTQITGSMQEGLVLLDEKGTVLSINHAACKLFQADEGCVGRDFLTVDRSHELCLAMETAREKGHSQLRCQRNGREYQLDMSRIQSDGETVGTVLLAFDVTEQEYAERNRREFTANVSHELKTPLQGIVGSAELIQSGMVKPGGYAPLCGPYPRRGLPHGNTGGGYHPPVPAGRGGCHAHGDGGPADPKSGGRDQPAGCRCQAAGVPVGGRRPRPGHRRAAAAV